MFHRLLLAVCCVLSASGLAAAEIDDLVAALRKGSEALAAKTVPDKTPDTTAQQRSAEALSSLAELDEALARGNAQGARIAAGRLELNPALNLPLQRIAEKIRRGLPELLDAREDEFAAAVDRLIVKTREQCLAAKTESDLAPLLRELSRSKDRQPGSQSPFVQRTVRKLDAAVQVVQGWSDYLAAKKAGHTERASAALGAMASREARDFYPIIPKAEIDSRLREIVPPEERPADLVALLTEIKSLKEIPAAARKIMRLPTAGPAASWGADGLQAWFVQFNDATVTCLSGNIGLAWERAAEIGTPPNNSWSLETSRLYSMLLGELLPKVLRLPANRTRQPDETGPDFLHRIAQEAAHERRWDEMERVLSIYQDSQWKMPALDEAMESVKAYRQGQRLEAAKDPAGAVAAYLRVLRSEGTMVPTAEARERLEKLLAAQNTSLADARARVESERMLALMEQIEARLARLKEKDAEADRARQGAATEAKEAVAESRKLAARVTGLETLFKKADALSAKIDELQTRLGKLETQAAPALAAEPAGNAAAGKVRLWLGPDFTVYRTAVPPELDKMLGWVVRFNGKTVLTRQARREMQFNYDARNPGNYTIYMTGDEHDNPISNVLDYTMTEEAAKKLGPRIIDDDWDRDGVRNPPGPRSP